MAHEKKDNDVVLIKITNVQPKVKDALTKAAEWEGVNLSCLLKPHLRRLADEYTIKYNLKE